MTIKHAIKEARDQVSLFRCGRGWIVSTFDTYGKFWTQSREKDWWTAREDRTNAIIERALTILGADPSEAFYGHESTSGRIESRVAKAAKSLKLV